MAAGSKYLRAALQNLHNHLHRKTRKVRGRNYMLDSKTRPGYATPCAQCGDPLIAPEWSEHVNERCIRHLWACEACGYEFETAVYLQESQAA